MNALQSTRNVWILLHELSFEVGISHESTLIMRSRNMCTNKQHLANRCFHHRTSRPPASLCSTGFANCLTHSNMTLGIHELERQVLQAPNRHAAGA
jgi:hypothetical protein